MAFASVLPSGGTTSVLLEREDHVASLQALADTARAGGGRLVVIEGTAGIGKTRLLGEFGQLPTRQECECWQPAAASSRASSPTESSGSCSNRYWRPSSRCPRRAALGACRACEATVHSVSAHGFRPRVCRGPRFLRVAPWPLLARGQRGVRAADPARDRRPPLGRHPLSAVAPPPDTKARGVPLLVAARRGRPKARVVIPTSSQSSSPTRRRPRFAPSRSGVRRWPCSHASCTVWSQTKHSALHSKRRRAGIRSSSARCSTPLRGRNQPDCRARAATAGSRRAGRSPFVAVRLARLQPQELALLRAASVLGDGTELRHAAALAGVEADALGPATTALVRLDLLRREDPLEVLPPRRPSRRLRDARCRRAGRRPPPGRRTSPRRRRSARERGRAPPPRGTPGRLVRGLDTPPGGGAHSLRAQLIPLSNISPARSRRTDRVGRAEVLVELGLAERLTNGPAAVDHLRAALEVLPITTRRCNVAVELGRASGSPTGSRMPLQSSSRRSTRSTASEIRTSTNCSGRS